MMLRRQDTLSAFDGTLSAGLVNPVTLRLFVRKSGWLTDVLSGRRRYTPAPDGLVCRLAESSPLIRYEVHDAYRNQIVHSPIWMVEGPQKRALSFLGTPAGYEVAAFIEAITVASRADSGLAPKVREILSRVSRPVEVEVFTHPLCPFCAAISATAYRFAAENPKISAKTIDAAAFPRLAKWRGVRTFPTVIVNGTFAFSGPKTTERFAQTLVERTTPNA
ncbi:MAG: thioredoxin family protein [Bacteroidia bacterium]|nr:thioredoxin family protein [Bacteroidia bacterium]MDW8332784.1 thioredoxin family protein [Bacteroidia bacterium]